MRHSIRLQTASLRLLLAAMLLALSVTAIAATPIDQTRPLDPTGRVEIENLKGRIQVRAWDQPEAKIRCVPNWKSNRCPPTWTSPV